MTAIFADDIYKARNMIACGLGNYFKRIGDPYELTSCGNLHCVSSSVYQISVIGDGVAPKGWFVIQDIKEKVYPYDK